MLYKIPENGLSSEYVVAGGPSGQDGSKSKVYPSMASPGKGEAVVLSRVGGRINELK